MDITDTSSTWTRALCLFARQLYERLQVRIAPQHRIIRIGTQLDEAGVIGGFVMFEGEFTVQADTLAYIPVDVLACIGLCILNVSSM